MSQESFPRHSARTQRFTAGSPRAFTVSSDGGRVLFLRSTSSTDHLLRLWSLDVASGAETLVADPATLHSGPEELSAAELARRERMREAGGGIVGYSTDAAATVAAFPLGGALHVAALSGAPGATRRLDVPGPVVDPQVSPDGSAVAYVSDRSLRVVRVDGTDDRSVAEPAHELESTGLVDFAAAEELRRHTGFWWSSDSDALLVERVDTAPLDAWWIADPVHPDRAALPHRYPRAGAAHARCSLEVVRLDGAVTQVAWDTAAHPYLVDVSWTPLGDPLLVVTTRGQEEQVVLAVDPSTGRTSEVETIRDEAWVDPWPGGTRWAPDGRLLTVRADHVSDTFRLHLGDDWLTPAGLQVRGVLDVDADGVLLRTAPDPLHATLHRVGWDGAITPVGPSDGWSIGRSAGGTDVVVSRRLGSSVARHVVIARGVEHEVTSYAEGPEREPEVHLIEAGSARLRAAVLLPHGHVPGSRRLPVLMSPYAGPLSQKVIASGVAFGEAQWFADQGFCVVVCDGRGTPGRGPAWERAVLGDLATPALEDQVAALDAVAQQWPDDVDLGRVGIRGWSFGGYLAALAVLRRPDVFHAAVAGAPVTEWRLYDAPYTERYLGDPAENPGTYDACSLLPMAASLSRPLLVIHGFTDDNVTVAHSLRLSGALTAAGRPHAFLPLSGVTHQTTKPEVAENKLLLELDFLTRALGV